MCAGQAVLEAAGGVWTDTSGGELKYKYKDPVLKRGFVASASKASHARYIDQLRTHQIDLGSSSGDLPGE